MPTTTGQTIFCQLWENPWGFNLHRKDRENCGQLTSYLAVFGQVATGLCSRRWHLWIFIQHFAPPDVRISYGTRCRLSWWRRMARPGSNEVSTSTWWGYGGSRIRERSVTGSFATRPIWALPPLPPILEGDDMSLHNSSSLRSVCQNPHQSAIRATCPLNILLTRMFFSPVAASKFRFPCNLLLSLHALPILTYTIHF